MSKQYELIVFGATSFTAKIAVAYIAKTQTGLKWAVGGRNRQKLESTLKELSVDVPIVVADSGKQDEVEAMVKQTKALITFAGPYARYGETVIAACAKNGVHYFDLTGETVWTKKMIEKYGVAAIESGAIVMPSCGYDSIPSDITTFLAVQQLKRLGGPQTEAATVNVAQSLRGGASGGTVASLWDILDSPMSEKKQMANSYLLSPVQGSDRDRPQFIYKSSFKNKTTWGSFFVMSPHNGAVVRRTAGILAGTDDASMRLFSYGAVKYREFIKMPNAIVSMVLSSVFFFVFALLSIPPIRAIAKRILPQPGQGPSEQAQKSGWFVTQATAESSDKRFKTQVTLKGRGDPGYSATAKMIVEAALSVVQDYDRLPPIAKKGGFLTPAAALGNVLVERLEKTGFFSFRVDSETVEDKKRK